MSEAFLFLVILALLGFICYQEWNSRRERDKFVNALIARTPEQFRDLELTRKVEPIKSPERANPDFVPEGDLSDDEFLKSIEQPEGIEKEIA